ncbi:unnamed protein product [Meganyctiphanes norvegica]|uniref:C2H2-type domain-containing protein n=1 Tax=Meganyctiphanes norvegica TaxID=48144 RepID=A0AAV2RN03_MEGNR
MNDPWSYIASLGIQHHDWDQPLFQEGNDLCRPLQKAPCIDLDDEELLYKSLVVISCVFPGCQSAFNSVADHAAHQHACHSHMCGVCKRNLSSHHLLDLHLLEAHDSFFQLQAERQPMYQCLLDTCSETFKNAQERKEHCMASHSFPADFRFDLSWRGGSYGNKKDARLKPAKANKDLPWQEQTNKKKGNDQIKGQKKTYPFSMEYEERTMETPYNSNLEEMNTYVPEEANIIATDEFSKSVNLFQTTDIDYTTNSNETSKIKVPKHICFGVGASRGFPRGVGAGRGSRGGVRGRGSRGSNPHWHQRHRTASSSGHNSIEEVNMADIEQALDESVATS